MRRRALESARFVRPDDYTLSSGGRQRYEPGHNSLLRSFTITQEANEASGGLSCTWLLETLPHETILPLKPCTRLGHALRRKRTQKAIYCICTSQSVMICQIHRTFFLQLHHTNAVQRFDRLVATHDHSIDTNIRPSYVPSVLLRLVCGAVIHYVPVSINAIENPKCLVIVSNKVFICPCPRNTQLMAQLNI